MNFANKTEVIKNWVEIVAIILAGVWATFTFVIKDSPNLHQAIDSNIEVFIDSLNTNTVSILMSINFKNMGQQTVHVNGAKIEYWIFPTDSIVSKHYFLANDIFLNNSPDYWVTFSSLDGRYTTDQAAYQSLTFFLQRDPKSTIIFRTDLSVSRNGLFSSTSESVYSYWYSFQILPDKQKVN